MTPAEAKGQVEVPTGLNELTFVRAKRPQRLLPFASIKSHYKSAVDPASVRDLAPGALNNHPKRLGAQLEPRGKYAELRQSHNCTDQLPGRACGVAGNLHVLAAEVRSLWGLGPGVVGPQANLTPPPLVLRSLQACDEPSFKFPQDLSQQGTQKQLLCSQDLHDGPHRHLLAQDQGASRSWVPAGQAVPSMLADHWPAM